MDNNPANGPRRSYGHSAVLKLKPVPPGGYRRGTNMARLEREAARRKWLMISGAVLAALVAGVLIGRFLLP